MMFALVLSFLLPVCAAFLLLCLVWPGGRHVRTDIGTKVCLAVGIGIGLSSCLFFILMNIGLTGRAAVIVDGTLQVITIIALAMVMVSRGFTWSSEHHGKRGGPMDIVGLLTIAFYFVLLVQIFVFIALSFSRPHGGWDAWAIWNMRARFLARAGADWREAFSPTLGVPHLDYPCLIPMSIARAWLYGNHESPIIPVIISLLFTFSTVGLMVSALSLLKNRYTGLMAGLVLMGTPVLFQQSLLQYADIPLAYYILSTLVLLTLHGRDAPGRKRYLILAGLMTGLSAWTKNEGLLFLVAILFSYAILVVFRKGRGALWPQSFPILAGLMIVLPAIVLLKAHFASSNEDVSPQNLDVSAKQLFEPARYQDIAFGFILRITSYGDGRLSPFAVLIPLLFLLGLDPGYRSERGLRTAALVLPFMFMGYVMVYLITPNDLGWHILTSRDRLLLHLWPSFLFSFFLLVKSTEGDVRSSTPC